MKAVSAHCDRLHGGQDAVLKVEPVAWRRDDPGQLLHGSGPRSFDLLGRRHARRRRHRLWRGRWRGRVAIHEHRPPAARLRVQHLRA